MKIALIGYGRMGQMVEKAALEKGHTIVAIIDRNGPVKDINKHTLKNADVCIEFTHPDCVMHNIEAVANAKKNLIVGTTGWYDQLPQVEKIIKKNGIGCLYTPNFSMGVQLFLRMVENAALMLDQFDEYDVGGFESHHSQKADSPSGTTKDIAKTLLNSIQRKTSVVYDLGNRKIESHELHFPSLRCGSSPGTHHVAFDSPSDTITLAHVARNREGFAKGAIKAAEWIEGKLGLYKIEDMLFKK